MSGVEDRQHSRAVCSAHAGLRLRSKRDGPSLRGQTAI